MGTPKDGTWLAEARERRGYTYQSDAIRALGRVGIRVDASTFSAWESGARTPKPSNRTYRQVVEFFGVNDKESPGGGSDTPAAGLSELVELQAQLVVAFEVQAQAVKDAAATNATSQATTSAAIADLVRELKRDREAEVRELRATGRALVARIEWLEAKMRSLHPEPADTESGAPSAPLQTEE